MRKLAVSEFVSLDGVMQAPGGKDEDPDGGFEHGGWTLPYWHDDIGKSFLALMQDVAHDLVDELHLLVYPLTLGSGKRALPGGVHGRFGLTSATPYPTGVLGLHYARQRDTR